MITKEQKKEAVEIIEQYISDQSAKLSQLIPILEDKIKKRTGDKNWYASIKIGYRHEPYVELSNSEYDEDYGGYYDKYFESLAKDYDIKIKVEHGLYGK